MIFQDQIESLTLPKSAINEFDDYYVTNGENHENSLRA